MSANLTNPRAIARFAGTCFIGLAIDLLTKRAAVHQLKGQEPVQFIPGWMNFEYTENHGAVFGIGQGQWLLFVVVSIFAIGLLSYLFATGSRRAIPQIVLGMLLAGVLGNMYDRVRFNYVRDMIHALPDWLNPLRGMFPTWHYVFPWIFNVADIMLCTGVGLTLVMGLFQKQPERPTPNVAPMADDPAR